MLSRAVLRVHSEPAKAPAPPVVRELTRPRIHSDVRESALPRVPAPLPVLGVVAVAGLVLVADVRDARACGGCFHVPPPPDQVDSTVVTDHRMAFAVSPAQTVLWDQIRYSGNPSEFAWVLPVRQGARIELSQDAWIASLDAATTTIIQGPQPACAAAPAQNTGGGCGFASSDSASGAMAFNGGGSGGGGVQVVSESVVGPYDAVTVRASEGEALGDWLRNNGYAVPEQIQPTIDAFTSEGFDFIALKLRPGEGVQAMQPVRVVTAGAGLSLPLRMVAAGVGPNVGIVLFVLSEGRYHPQNFPDAAIDFSKLTWDPYNNISNYETLASAAMAANGGASWLTESSGSANLGATYYGYGSSTTTDPPLDGTYSATCSALTLPPPASCGMTTEDGGDEASGEGDGSAKAGEAGEDGSPSGEAGFVTGDAQATAADGGACASTTIPCDDLQLVMTGIPAGNLWVTRLRAFLPASALANDLALEASASQEPVSSFHSTNTYSDPKYNPCPNGAAGSGSGSCACRTAEGPRFALGNALLFGLGATLVGFSLRRGRRR